jgi:hypothetical protein
MKGERLTTNVMTREEWQVTTSIHSLHKQHLRYSRSFIQSRTGCLTSSREWSQHIHPSGRNAPGRRPRCHRWQPYHGFLQEGWGYAVGLTWINRHEADSYRLGPKTAFLSRGIGRSGIEEGVVQLACCHSRNLGLSCLMLRVHLND